MRFIKFYYKIKPFISRKTQIAIRRIVAEKKRKRTRDSWPISPRTAEPPRNWKGWPENKKFAVVIIHDVDTVMGLANIFKLAEVDKERNFRASFNFAPGEYWVPPWFLQLLKENGFEIGIHGFKHDGKMFTMREIFEKRKQLINYYLKKWEAVGFVSPSMIRNFEWLAELDIDWDCSSFDTDPFEPHAGDMLTVFPFIFTHPKSGKTYVEIPYTLPQDHCLFVILREKSNQIWKEKLDWIVKIGGMAMLNVHPDYINFKKTSFMPEQYPINFYTDLLDYIKTKYEGQYWNPLPREMAAFWRDTFGRNEKNLKSVSERIYDKQSQHHLPIAYKKTPPPIKIWIDLDNTPHVPFFIPIIRELERRGYKVVITARDAFQVCELANKKGLKYECIGHHYGRNIFKKLFGLFTRSLQLVPFLKKEKPDLAISHGARSQILISKILKLPSLMIIDYEYSQTLPLPVALPHWLIVPEALMNRKLLIKPSRVRYYRGIKEDVYVPEFKPDPIIYDELKLQRDAIVVTIRPPADEAHYFNPESYEFFLEFMKRALISPDVQAVLLPRHSIQKHKFLSEHPEWFNSGKIIIPDDIIDGLNLLWASDLLVSGGGTMNREAAALGIPAYSIFRGEIGAIDTMLEKEGRLQLITNKEEIWTKIKFIKRDKNRLLTTESRPALEDIINSIEDIIRLNSN